MHRTKCFGIFAVVLALVLTFGSMSLACGTNPAPTPSEPEIPANYTTYTDESNVFSISYPADWETALSLIAGLEQSAKEAINSLKTGVSVEKASIIFLAGRRTATGYEPSVNIAIEPVPEGVSTTDQLVEAEVQGVKKSTQDYREFSRVKTTVNGRETAIVDFEGTPTGASTKLHFLQMSMLVNKTAWVVTCVALPDDFSSWENDFNAIVRSLRISN